MLPAVGWSFGFQAHATIADYAETILTEDAKAKLDLVAKGKSLADLAVWPDQVKHNESWRYTRSWHYVNLDDGDNVTDFIPAEKIDLLWALDYHYHDFKNRLDQPIGNDKERWRSLAFLIHFIGDVHQPLHVGRYEDRGGNRIAVLWFGQESNLHRVWDTDFFKHQNMSRDQWMSELSSVAFGLFSGLFFAAIQNLGSGIHGFEI